MARLLRPHAMLLALSWIAGAAAATTGDRKATVRDIVAALFAASDDGVVDFSRRDLSNLDLSTVDFRRARLRDVNLFGADLSDANLRGADLSGSNLDRTTLLRTDFSGADLSHATLLLPAAYESVETANTHAPRFRATSLRRSRIFAVFYRVDLSEADLSYADLRRYTAGVGRTTFRYCNLSGANFTGANLTQVNFSDSNLSGANLRNAILTGANLSNADLRGADLTGAVLTGTAIDSARIEGAIGLRTRRPATAAPLAD